MASSRHHHRPTHFLFPQTHSSILPSPAFFSPNLLSSPLPANSFFQNFTLKSGDQLENIHPYLIKYSNSSLSLSFLSHVVTPAFQTFTSDLTISSPSTTTTTTTTATDHPPQLRQIEPTAFFDLAIANSSGAAATWYRSVACSNSGIPHHPTTTVVSPIATPFSAVKNPIEWNNDACNDEHNSSCCCSSGRGQK